MTDGGGRLRRFPRPPPKEAGAGLLDSPRSSLRSVRRGLVEAAARLLSVGTPCERGAFWRSERHGECQYEGCPGPVRLVASSMCGLIDVGNSVAGGPRAVVLCTGLYFSRTHVQRVSHRITHEQYA